jgi:jumonji domain-containing protein 7
MPAAAARSNLRPLLSNLWLGRGETISPLHYDPYENLLCQISGVKHLMLFPPSDAPLLDYAARRKGQLRYAWPNNFTRASVSEHRVIFASSVNLTEPNEARHGAALRLARPLRCEIRGGETLYLPAWWHHEVRSAGAPAGEINLAVNFWFRNETAPPDGM